MPFLQNKIFFLISPKFTEVLIDFLNIYFIYGISKMKGKHFE